MPLYDKNDLNKAGAPGDPSYQKKWTLVHDAKHGTYQTSGGLHNRLQAQQKIDLHYTRTGGKAQHLGTFPDKHAAETARLEHHDRVAAGLHKDEIVSVTGRSTKPHPHAYEWHDGHTSHYRGLVKADQPTPPAASPTPAHQNDQAAGVGVPTYAKFAAPYGTISPGTSTDLLHYPYQGKLPDIEKLVGQHGFQTYYAGGKYGKPDLANKNYNTKHLMVYDPTPQSGGDFGQEEYTKGWRQIHELAHALTYPQLNQIYGEGRRIGKLGTHRTMNEALRAVHWEHLAAHKQRELSSRLGINIPDETFNKEYNTVMHDAIHRAVTGKFTEPSAEGFVPHGKPVHLNTALQMVRDAGQQMGLSGLHETIAKKSEVRATILKTEGDSTVADNKTYTVEEAAEILRKEFQERLAKHSKEIEALVQREDLSKSIIPKHHHEEGAAASSGTEDIAAGQANPKGMAKSDEEKSAGSLKWREMVRHGRQSRKPKAEGSRANVIEHSAYADKSHTPKDAKKRYSNHPSVGEYTITPHKPHNVNFWHTQTNGPKHLGAHGSLDEAKVAAEKHHASMAPGAKSDTEKSDDSMGMDTVKGESTSMGHDRGGNHIDSAPAHEHKECVGCGAKNKTLNQGGECRTCADEIDSQGNGTKKAEACAKCGEMHDNMKKCGEVTMKSDLVDSKGNKSNNETDPKAAPMPGKNPKEPSDRSDSSGGKVTKSGGPAAMAKRAMSMTKAEDDDDKYHHYVIGRGGVINSGWEHKEDAHDDAKENKGVVVHRTMVSPEAKNSFHSKNQIMHKLHKDEMAKADEPTNWRGEKSGCKKPTPKEDAEHNEKNKAATIAGKKGIPTKPGDGIAKAGMGAPPTAKPPGGAAPATAAAPTSKPAAPPKMGMGKSAEDLGKAGLGMAQHGQREAAQMGFGAKPAAPAAKVKLPGQAAQAARGADMHSQMADVTAANAKPAAAKPTLPKPSATGPAGKALGLASPKAAGVTQSAGPVQNAARPAKPGIFGKLFGKK